MVVLDAHVLHDGPFTVDDLEPYRYARVPESQQQALNAARSCARRDPERNALRCLADLEKRYLNAPSL